MRSETQKYLVWLIDLYAYR